MVLRHTISWALFETYVTSLDSQLESLIRQMRRILSLMDAFSPLTLPFRPYDKYSLSSFCILMHVKCIRAVIGHVNFHFLCHAN